jgi:hypothetical protein
MQKQNRRAFLKTAALSASAFGFAKVTAHAATTTGAAKENPRSAAPASATLPYWHCDKTDIPAIRACWAATATRLATPMLDALSRRQLRATMPVEVLRPERRHANANVTHLEALGRLLAGIAPWLELRADASPEGRARARCAALAREALDAATDPNSPDLMNFTDVKARQPLVDAAFLVQAILRAPRELWQNLAPRVRANLIAGVKATRPIKPGVNNWQLFAAMVEAFLHHAGEKRDDERLFGPLRNFREWYCGDGWYGDGPEFHTDYYNAFVIQPMLVEILDIVGDEAAEWRDFRKQARARLARHAAVQERFIAPDGSFPIVGRSITYRCGAFQSLALAALRKQLPAELAPAQARAALTSVIRRTLEAPGTFDEKGWLRIGVAGSQLPLAETYISTGSLYLCSFALLPLGLPPSDAFWSAPAAPTTWEKVWSGDPSVRADKALRDKK